MIIKTKKQLDDLSKPLTEIDAELLIYAEERSCDLVKNYQSWPSRSLKWVAPDETNRKIGIYLEDNLKTFKVIGYVWLDDHGQRFIKKIRFSDNIRPPLDLMLEKHLSGYINELDNISKEDLEKS